MRAWPMVGLLLGLAATAPSHGQESPGVDTRPPSVASGSGEASPESPVPICWDEPWRLSPFAEPRTASATTSSLDADAQTAAPGNVAAGGETDSPDTAPWKRWALGGGALAALAVVLGLLARRRGEPSPATRIGDRKELERWIETAVDRRLSALGPHATAANSATGDVEQATMPEQLDRVARQLSAQLKQESGALCEELRGTLRQEARRLREDLRRDVEVGDSPIRRLSRELAQNGNQPVATFEAAGRLGFWIDRLWPALASAAGLDVKSMPGPLSESAASEWCQAARILRTFSGPEAAALRRLVGWTSGATAHETLPEPMELACLEDTGLLTGERPLSERLRRYFEPFDHIGRLGEVTLALQYLTEAFPIEQLSKDRRSQLRRELAESHRDAGLEEDFHHLVAQVAAGIGLHYSPVRYYKSRTDQSEYAFVRQQISPISLSERVGFEATADKATIVRLKRPFFFQLDTGIYYAGHAHVAR